MVSKNIEPIDQINQHIENGESFLLSGGAGSGKTYSLTEVLNFIYKRNPLVNVACITFTNVAVDEIKNRAPYKNMRASTIHFFLWDSIKNYQKNLKKSLIDLICQETKEEKSGIKYAGDLDLDESYFSDKEINYKEYKKIEEGIISHDEVLTRIIHKL